MTAYIILMFMWGSGDHSNNPVSVAEFSSQERCETAANTAKATFSGWGSHLYYVCVAK